MRGSARAPQLSETCQHGADAGGAHGVVRYHGRGQALQTRVLPPLQLRPSRCLLNGTPERRHQELRQHLLPCIFRVAAAAQNGAEAGQARVMYGYLQSGRPQAEQACGTSCKQGLVTGLRMLGSKGVRA